MSKRWTYEEDAFLLEYHGAVDANFIASHDLGRPHGAGAKRLKKLQEAGAELAYAKMRLAQTRFDVARGSSLFDPDFEIARLEDQVSRLQASEVKL